MIKYLILDIDSMPPKDYREACHFEGDVREFAKRVGTIPFEAKNDLGTYLTVPMIVGGVALQVFGLAPFLDASFTVAADPLDRQEARRVVKLLLVQIQYDVEEYKDKCLPDLGK